MNNREVTQMAYDLMNLHNVSHLEFRYNNRKQALGVCRFRGGKAYAIELSRVFLPYLSEKEIKDTLLHEIAHAIAGASAHHGPKWKSVARAIGANPTRTAEEVPREVIQRALRRVSKYRATCKSCDNIVYFQRMTKNWRHNGYRCGKCQSEFKVSYN